MMAPEQEIPLWLESRLDKPVAIFGRGASGRAASDLLDSLGVEIEVFDQRHQDAAKRDFDTGSAEAFGMAVCSPGFPSNHPWLKAAREAGLEVVPEPDLGAAFWRGPIVAITGTNGKTTLTEFLAAAFGSAGIEAYACGNIGRPISGLVADGVNCEAIAVCEVSSFQAEISQRLNADYLLWTNFDEDHLDRHGSLGAYFKSKYKLAEMLRGEVFLYDGSVRAFAEEIGLMVPKEGLVDGLEDASALGVSGTPFEREPELNNYLMARELWFRMGLPEGELIEAAHNFRKSPHRMELVSSRNGVSYWDDSKATNFHAVFGALKRFEKPVIWIGGGKDKGGDLERFARRIAPAVGSAHLIGETSEALASAFRELGVEARVYGGLEEAVAGANSVAESGSNILLSPGFASLDMFESYSQRGELFRKAINSLEQP